MLWLDGKDSNTLVLSGSSVLTWKDKTPRQCDASAIVAPSYDSGTGVVFNGTNQWMSLPDATFPTGNSGYSVIAVLRSNSIHTTAGNRVFFSSGAAATNNALEGQLRGSGIIAHEWYSSAITSPIGRYTSNVPIVIGMTYTTGRFRNIYANGVLVRSIQTTAIRLGGNRNNRLGVDLNRSATSYFNGSISEIMVYDGELPRSDRTRLEGYLAWKWGIQTSTTSFNPLADVPNCIGWWDATDTATISLSGTYVTQWNDKSIVSNVPFVSMGTLRVLSTSYPNSMNGKNVIRTPGQVGIYMRQGNLFRASWGTTTWFVACRPVFPWTGTNARLSILESSSLSTGGTPATAVYYSSAAASATLNIASSGGTAATAAVYSSYLSQNMVFMFNQNPANGSNLVSYNGTIQNSFARTGSADWRGVAIGAGAPSSTNANAPVMNAFSIVDYGEILIYSGNLLPDAYTKVTKYLANKWGADLASELSRSHPYSYFPVYSSPLLDPNDFAACIAWYDATDYRTLTLNGNQITQIRDKSISGRDLTVSNNPPTLGTMNNLTTMRFSGSNCLCNSTSFGLPITTGESLFIVAQASSGSNLDTIFGPTSTRRVAVTGPLPSSVSIISTSQSQNSSFLLTSNTPFLLSLITDISASTRSAVVPYFNGLRYGDVSANNGRFINTVNLGGMTPSFFNGDIGEFMMFSGLSSNSHRAVEAYLQKKWKLPQFMTPTVPTIWAPTDISGCVLWMDAADGNFFGLNVAKVTSWLDKSSNAYLFTTSNGPNWIPDGDRSNVVNFPSGASTYLSNTAATIPSGQHTLVVVHKPLNLSLGSSSVNTRVFSYGSPQPQITFPTTTSFVQGTYATTFGPALSNTALQTGSAIEYEIITASILFGSQAIYRNGILMSRESIDLSRNITVTGLSIGRHSAGFGFYYFGNVCEMVAYNRQIGPDSLDSLHAYLGAKWAIPVKRSNPHSMYGMIPTSPAFHPGVVDGLLYWFDGNDSSTLTVSNNSVTRWVNKTGFQSAGPSGNSTYNSTTKGVFGKFALPEVVASNTVSVFAMSYVSNVSSTILLSFGASSQRVALNNGNGVMSLVQTTSGVNTTGNKSAPVGAMNMIYAAADISLSTGSTGVTFGLIMNASGTMTGWAGGAPPLTATGGSFGNDCNGTFHEMMLYARPLAQEERQKIEGYLAWKWNIQSVLPSNHPYFYVKPL
jgi:hypothetical protein